MSGDRIRQETRTVRHYAQQYENEEQRRRQEQASASKVSKERDRMFHDMMGDCDKTARRVAEKRSSDASFDAEAKGFGTAMVQDAARRAYKAAYTDEMQSCAAEAKEDADNTEAKAKQEAALRAQADAACQRAANLEQEAATAEASAVKAGSDAAALQSQCNFARGQQTGTRKLLQIPTKVLTMRENLPGSVTNSVGEGGPASPEETNKVCGQAATAVSLANGSKKAAESARTIAHEAKGKCDALNARAKLAGAQKALEEAKARAQQLGRLCKLKKRKVTDLIQEVESPSHDADARGKLLAELEDAKESAQTVCEQAEQAAATASMKAAEATAASLANASAGGTSPEAMKALAAAKAKQCAASKLKASETKAKYGPEAPITKEEQKKSDKICAEAAAATAAANAAVAAFSAAQADGIADETQLSLEAAAAKAKAQAANAAAAAARLKLLCDQSKDKVRSLRQKLFTTPTADKPQLTTDIRTSEEESKKMCEKAAAAAQFADKLRQAALAAGSVGQHAGELKKLCESSKIKLKELEARGSRDPAVHATLPQVREETEKVCFAAERAVDAAAAAAAAKECRRLELKVTTLEEQGSPEVPVYEKKAKLACAAAAAAEAAASSAKLEAACADSKKSVEALSKIQPTPEELPSVIEKSKRVCAKAEAARARGVCLSKKQKVKALVVSKSDKEVIRAARMEAEEACAKAAEAAAAAQSAGVAFEQERLAALCESAKKELSQLKQDPSANAISIRSAEERMKDTCAAAQAHAQKSKAAKDAEANAAARAQAKAARLAAQAAKLAAACKVATDDLSLFERKIGAEGLNNPSLKEQFDTKRAHKTKTCEAAAAAAAKAAAAKLAADVAGQQSCAAAAAAAATKFEKLQDHCKRAKDQVEDSKAELQATTKAEEKEAVQQDLQRAKAEREEVCPKIPAAKTRSETLKSAEKAGQSLVSCLASADAAEAARLASLCKQHKSEAAVIETQLKASKTEERKATLQHEFTAATERAATTCAAAAKAADKAAASKSRAERGSSSDAQAQATALAAEAARLAAACDGSKQKTPEGEEAVDVPFAEECFATVAVGCEAVAACAAACLSFAASAAASAAFAHIVSDSFSLFLMSASSFGLLLKDALVSLSCSALVFFFEFSHSFANFAASAAA